MRVRRYLTRCANEPALQVRLCGMYLFHCPLRQHLRRAVRKVFNKPAPRTAWEKNGLRVVEGSTGVVTYAPRGGLPWPLVEGPLVEGEDYLL